MSLENSVMYPPLRRFGQQLKTAAIKAHNLSLHPVAAPGHLGSLRIIPYVREKFGKSLII